MAAQSREERLTSDIKLGHRSRLEAIHPFTGEKVPVFAANYVLMDYGTGAVMGVPAHDERDYEFAQKYGIPIPKVIESANPWEPGILVNSGEFTGLTSEAAVDAMVARLAGRAEKAVTFKLKDWGLSRQRYWGTPIPTVHCPDCGVVPEKEENLPVRLPEDVAFVGKGASPLTTSRSFLDCACPRCGGPARRETDTMDTFVDSSWYWMRYLDPANDQKPFAKAEADAWAPVDLYVGGIEHATMHLIYARYFYKVMRDLGLLSGDEPFKKLICQGMVLKDGFKMSKSRGNIVDPDEVIAHYGADALRLFMIFAAPIEKEIDWTGFEGIEGATRFLKRITRMVEEHAPAAAPIPPKEQLTAEEKALLVKIHQTLHKVTDDLSHRYQFNTLVSSLMELANALADLPRRCPAPGRHPAAGPGDPHPDAVPRRAAPGRAALDPPGRPGPVHARRLARSGSRLAHGGRGDGGGAGQRQGPGPGRWCPPAPPRRPAARPPWPAPRPASTWTARRSSRWWCPPAASW